MARDISEAVTIDQLKQLVDLDPLTGGLTWRERMIEHFADAECPIGSMRAWNTRFAGKSAFAKKLANGYLTGRLFGFPVVAHRVVWALSTGAWAAPWPACQIDHINGIRTDNRPENLRIVSASENCRNQRLRQNNMSGALGVNWDKRHGRWAAKIQHDGKRHFLGRFKSKDDAIAARKAAEQQYQYHPNHGTR
ncbi:HNH endonuclease [Novosphingobium sp. NBM11]|uniref:HNH endonuclease signature motif containing protein n=1 Tax=Novosphingobium sp. NBM11 TaxID=2596914 RepID=UPI0018926AC8|nr:HNH endonuclease signature motif containing protein [Novosphingobium sp. NBM11]MBF5091303.1 HNH endonuclease [Novosphingobium sp. NBM11]